MYYHNDGGCFYHITYTTVMWQSLEIAKICVLKICIFKVLAGSLANLQKTNVTIKWHCLAIDWPKCYIQLGHSIIKQWCCTVYTVHASEMAEWLNVTIDKIVYYNTSASTTRYSGLHSFLIKFLFAINLMVLLCIAYQCRIESPWKKNKHRMTKKTTKYRILIMNALYKNRGRESKSRQGGGEERM